MNLKSYFSRLLFGSLLAISTTTLNAQSLETPPVTEIQTQTLESDDRDMLPIFIFAAIVLYALHKRG